MVLRSCEQSPALYAQGHIVEGNSCPGWGGRGSVGFFWLFVCLFIFLNLNLWSVSAVVRSCFLYSILLIVLQK